MTDTINTLPAVQDEFTTSPRSESVRCAEEFLIHNIEKFDELKSSNDTTFAIPVSEWDRFIVDKRLVACVDVPNKGTAEWIKFRQDSNTIRYAMNKVSEIGMHGEPAFVVSNDRAGMLLVGTTDHILSVSFGDGMAAVKSLLVNKNNGAIRTLDYLRGITEELPINLQSKISYLDHSLDRAVQNLTFLLNGYNDDVKNVLIATSEYQKKAEEQKQLEDNPAPENAE